MRKSILTSAVLICVAVCAADAAAQVMQPPPRSTRGLFGAPRRAADQSRADHELTLTFSMLGGYEDNLSPEGTIATDPLATRRSGTHGLFSGNVDYSYGTSTRFISVNGRSYMNSFRDLGIQPMLGGEVNVNGTTPLGAKGGLTASVNGRYQPTFSLAAGSPMSPPADIGAIAPTDPTSGVSEMLTVGGNAVSTYTYNWSGRNRTTFSYGFSRQRVTADTVLNTRPQTEVNSTTHVASVAQMNDLSRVFATRISYQFSGYSSQQLVGPARPVDSHLAQGALEIRRRVSPTRRLVFTIGGGAMRVLTVTATDAQPFEYTAPNYHGGARLDLGRTWALTADVRRDVTVLEGITQQSFLTNVGSLWLGGNIGDSWMLVFTSSLSQGRPHEGEVGAYDSKNATAQLQYALSRCCSLVGSYSYYEHRLRDITTIPIGFPARFDRNAVSAGFSIWLPLYGSFPAGRPVSTGRN